MVVWAQVQPRNTEIWTQLDADGEAGRQEHVDHKPEDLEGGIALDDILLFRSITGRALFNIIRPIGLICLKTQCNMM